MSKSSAAWFDYALVGGGLQNGLIALALLAARPRARIALIERGASLGGNHVWCFHADDVPPAAAEFVDSLVVRRWDGYDVRFPGLERRIDSQYAAVSSERFDDVVSSAMEGNAGARLELGADVLRVGPDTVELRDGRTIRARAVVDARGPNGFDRVSDVGFQKFLGLELELDRPSPVTRPLLMDARVPQSDGFRFFYMLPLTERRVLVEDTYFADGRALDRDRARRDILAYAARAGLGVARIVREEEGTLPLPLAAPPRPSSGFPLAAGYQGGWFHPATGYSFPIAVRLALFVASRGPEELFGAEFDALAEEQLRQARFAALLNRLLFCAFEPKARFNALERFYRLPEPTIRRFYALSTTRADRLRILCGRPPRGISLRTALASRVRPGAQA